MRSRSRAMLYICGTRSQDNLQSTGAQNMTHTECGGRNNGLSSESNNPSQCDGSFRRTGEKTTQLAPTILNDRFGAHVGARRRGMTQTLISSVQSGWCPSVAFGMRRITTISVTYGPPRFWTALKMMVMELQAWPPLRAFLLLMDLMTL